MMVAVEEVQGKFGEISFSKSLDEK